MYYVAVIGTSFSDFNFSITDLSYVRHPTIAKVVRFN